ncbi:hypothetical protein RXV86_15805 [Alisedimentitalea sp. MJ-SS2]|uniref:hypothetical protein n=1 Tax=Aliisedimentitalea sp. MJ-SS2 TaxID=3049795 RepID=UPI002911E7F2|nr:hypothetical protein [Alisedimentitalea sp. MJ-SS2]MDU8928857.1 hypothetical protein [Alisedimentitalea sp. MJ-SS2]
MRKAAPPPIEIAEAPFDTPLLDHWRGVFDHVFFAFNPLFRVPVPPGQSLKTTSDDDGTLWVSTDHEANAYDAFDFFTWEKQQSETLRWSDLHSHVAPDAPFKDFAIALWLISVLGFQDAYRTLQQRILDYTERNAWFLPDENQMPMVMESAIGAFLSALGLDQVTAYNEFRWDKAPLAVRALAKDRPFNRLQNPEWKGWIGALHAPDPGVLIYWSFDDITTCIAMTDKAHAMAKPEDFFEGLRATPAMCANFLRQL